MRPTRISTCSRFHTKYPGGEFTPVDMVKQLHKVGFTAIDFDLESVPNMGPDWKAVLGPMAERAAKLDMALEMGHLTFTKIKKPDGSEDREQFHKNVLLGLDAADFLGIRHTVLHPRSEHTSRREDWEKELRENIATITPYAEKAQRLGIKLAFENMRSPKEAEGYHHNFCNADELIVLADYFGQGICWDFGHAHTTGLRQGDELRKIGSRLLCVHVNDNFGTNDAHLFPFFGTVDWADAMQGLGDIGFAHCFNFECSTARLPAEVRDALGPYAVALAHRLIAMMGPDETGN